LALVGKAVHVAGGRGEDVDQGTSASMARSLICRANLMVSNRAASAAGPASGTQLPQRTRLKNQVHASCARNLLLHCPASDLFGIKSRAWPAQQDLLPDEQSATAALLRQLDFHADELRLIDADLGQAALARLEVLRLMTIPGSDATVAYQSLPRSATSPSSGPRRS
jgi:hypothetical protein